MTDREKLIKVLMKQVGYTLPVFTATQTIELLADCLISNGVTFSKDKDVPIKWISVEDRLPDLIPCNAGTAYSEAVTVWTSGRKAMVAVWDGNAFLCAADYWEAWGETITHWMPLPEPPGGDAE